MPERKTRAKTGCLSCRQRRVKCDEQRPNCVRCQKANILCAGYEPPRTVSLKKRNHETSSTPESKFSLTSSLDGSMGNDVADTDIIMHQDQAFDKPLTMPDALSQNPGHTTRGTSHTYSMITKGSSLETTHTRALEALAYEQYTTRTVKVLFHGDHQDLWNGIILSASWSHVFVFDAIIALGAIHRALSLLARESTRQLGVQTQVMAFETYGNAISQLQKVCEEPTSIDRGLLVSVLVLLTYFEVSNHSVSAMTSMLKCGSSPLLAMLQAHFGTCGRHTTISLNTTSGYHTMKSCWCPQMSSLS